MKHVKFLSLTILLTFFLFACSENNNNKTSSSGDKETAPPPTTTSSAGNANWSCVIDGQPASGDLIGLENILGHQTNAAYIDDVDEGKELLFYLSDTKKAYTQGFHLLRFSVPAKAGISSFGPEENGWGIEVDIIVNKDHTARYNSDSFTINVNTLSATRVSGTFSGKFSLNGNINDTDKKAIEVTDGKFDIPMKQ
jgi:hypothetical protein